MGKRIAAIIAGVAVLTLVVLAVTALTTQTRPASAETGNQGAATALQSPNAQECGSQCPGQNGAEGVSGNAAQECGGCAATADQAGAQGACPGGGDCGQ
jgi:hypothetical protein